MNQLNDTPTRHGAKRQPVLSSSDKQSLAKQLKALAHPVRLQILQSLGVSNKCCCNDICAGIPLAQSTISQHLKILNEAGIVSYQTVGNCSHYSLNPAVLAQAIGTLSKLGEMAANTDRCGQSRVSEQPLRANKKPTNKMEKQ